MKTIVIAEPEMLPPELAGDPNVVIVPPAMVSEECFALLDEASGGLVLGDGTGDLVEWAEEEESEAAHAGGEDDEESDASGEDDEESDASGEVREGRAHPAWKAEMGEDEESDASGRRYGRGRGEDDEESDASGRRYGRGRGRGRGRGEDDEEKDASGRRNARGPLASWARRVAGGR